MTTCPQTLRAQRSTLAGTPTNPPDELVRMTLDACEQVHDACLQAVQQALRAKHIAPPLNDWLAGASLCRTLAEVLAVEAPHVEGAVDRTGATSPRQALSPWAVGMAQLCADLCSELAARHAGDDEMARTLRQACEACVHACLRLLADAGPPGGLREAAPALDTSLASVTSVMRHLRHGTLPPQASSLPAAA